MSPDYIKGVGGMDSMSVHQHNDSETYLRSLFEALSEGDIQPLIDAMSDDFCWTVKGTSRWSRAYVGKQAVVQDLLMAVGSQFASKYTVSARRFIFAGEYVVVECNGDVLTTSGERYNNAYCWIIRTNGRRLQELIEFGDTRLIDAVLAAPTQ